MFYHILFTCPKLGLYKESTKEALVMHDLRAGIVKQLSEMTLERFAEYCEVRKYKTDIMDEKGSIPLYNQESESNFKTPT